jgi:outer membrane receptor protein involved in Fe transport
MLIDGLPAGDPWAGWVGWSGPATLALARVEAVRGPVPLLWGTGTGGGLVRLVRPDPAPSRFLLDASAGERDTGTLGVTGGGRAGGWWGEGEAAFLDTEGGPAVPSEQRGPIDGRAWGRLRGLAARLGHERPGGAAWLRVRAGDEEHGLGTPLQSVESEALAVAVGGRAGRPLTGQWDVAVTGSRQMLRRFMTTQPEARDAEVPALLQEVPSAGAGLALAWTRRFLRQSGEPGPHLFTTGVDVTWADGESREGRVDASGQLVPRRAGGGAMWVGLYAQDVDAVLPWLEVTMAARLAYWRSLGGFVDESADSTEPTRRPVGGRDALWFTQRTAVRVDVGRGVTLRAAIGEGFRPPTLDEQYATARLRSDVTLPEARLAPERSASGELGLEVRGPAGLALRAAGFWTEIVDAIGAVAVTAEPMPRACPPGSACRLRANLDRARVAGVEAEAAWAPASGLRLRAGYLYQDGRVREADVAPALRGRRLAQVPAHQLAAELWAGRPAGPGVAAALRVSGVRFEDAENRVRLDPAVGLDLSAWLPVGRWGELYVAADNALGAEIGVARSADGIVSLGPPRTIRGGIRLRF